MKPIPRHTHSIELEFTNAATNLLCFRLTIPLNRKRDNSISKWYRKLKPAIASAEEIPEWRIRGKHNIIETDKRYIDRLLFEWPGGIALDIPSDATSYDYEIILAQLNVLKMSRA